MIFERGYPIIHKIANKGGFIYILAAMLGLVDVLFAFPIKFLTGQQGFYWGDLAANVSGYYAFRDSAWSIPILWSERLNFPEGFSLIQTDSIAPLALIFKLFPSVLPADFHYFGLWYGLVYVLQAVGGVYLIRQMGLRRWWHGALAAAFALLMPAFVLRAGHTALMTHVIVLIALGLYFQALRLPDGQKPSNSWYLTWMILISFSFALHVYLAAMILPIYWVALLDQPQVRRSWRGLAIGWGTSIVVTTASYLAFWYAPTAANVMGDLGYGTFSMNLLAPFVGRGIIHWEEKYLPMIGQGFEGFNYLGLGVMGLILLAVAIKTCPVRFYRLLQAITPPKTGKIPTGMKNDLSGQEIPSWRQTLARHKFFILLLIGLTIYAVSNTIYAGQTLVFTYPERLSRIISPLTSLFRSSGRFFWPVGYTMLFAALSIVLSFGKKWAIGLVVLLLFVQIIDVPETAYALMAPQEARARQIYPEASWEKLIQGKDMLYLEPAWMCGAGFEDVPTLQMLAARNQVLVDTIYAARQSPDCRLKLDRARNNVKKGTLHVYFNSIPQQQIEKWLAENATDWCRRYSQGTVCVPYPDPDDLEVLNSDDFLPFDALNIQIFPLYSLRGNTGVAGVFNRIANEEIHLPGYLTSGPYVQLPAGKYYFQLKYQSTASHRTSVGRVEVFTKELNNDSSRGYLGKLPFNGSKGEETVLTGSFVLGDDLQTPSLEVRVYWDGVGDLAVDRILIYRLEETSAAGKN